MNNVNTERCCPSSKPHFISALREQKAAQMGPWAAQMGARPGANIFKYMVVHP